MQMMANWQALFDLPCSQILITHGDLKDRQRYINIKNTLRTLLDNMVIPIVNENDTVATDELKVGDNDNLAALVALVSEADALFILSDIDGVYDSDPRINKKAELVPLITEITDEVRAMAGITHNVIATGGMKTKIEAAEKAIENGIDTFIVNGHRSEVFEQLLKGKNPGTYFVSGQATFTARKHWLKHTLKSHGQLRLDSGAVHALLSKGASLLPSGVKHVVGKFSAGESIDLLSADSEKVIAKGICQYSSHDLTRIKGLKSDQIEDVLGFCPSKVVIHRDDLVILAITSNSPDIKGVINDI
jgi:glutamate 5-kinase